MESLFKFWTSKNIWLGRTGCKSIIKSNQYRIYIWIENRNTGMRLSTLLEAFTAFGNKPWSGRNELNIELNLERAYLIFYGLKDDPTPAEIMVKIKLGAFAELPTKPTVFLINSILFYKCSLELPVDTKVNRVWTVWI